jgi:hypothetical protein
MMSANRQTNGITSKMATVSITPPTPKSSKQEIIEKKPKHKKLREHFEAIVERVCSENESESE